MKTSLALVFVLISTAIAEPHHVFESGMTDTHFFDPMLPMQTGPGFVNVVPYVYAAGIAASAGTEPLSEPPVLKITKCTTYSVEFVPRNVVGIGDENHTSEEREPILPVNLPVKIED